MKTGSPCPYDCDIPEGWVETPPPRHRWDGMAFCPNEGCGRAFILLPAGLRSGAAADVEVRGERI